MMKERFGIFATLALTISLSTQAMAWSVEKSVKHDSNAILHYVACDSGKVVEVQENKDVHRFFVSGSSYESISAAAKSNCSTSADAENVDKSWCESFYNSWNKKLNNDMSISLGESIKDNKDIFIQCANVKHVRSMCIVAVAMDEGKNGFPKDRRKASRIAKDAISLSHKESSLCRMHYLM